MLGAIARGGRLLVTVGRSRIIRRYSLKFQGEVVKVPKTNEPGL